MSKFCMNCGTELPEKALFCRKCGTKLEVFETSIVEETPVEKSDVIRGEITEPVEGKHNVEKDEITEDVEKIDNTVIQEPVSKPVITNFDTKKRKNKLDMTKLDPTLIVVVAMILITIIVVVIILVASGNKTQKDNTIDVETVEDVDEDDIGISVVGTSEIEEPEISNDIQNTGNDIEDIEATDPSTAPSENPDEPGNGTTENPDSMSPQEFVNAWGNDPYLSIFEVPKFGESITIFKYDGYSSAFFYGWTTDEASTFGYDTVNAAGFTKNVQTQIDADNFYYVGSNNQGYGVMVVKEQGGYVMVSVGDYGIMMGSSSTTVDDKVDSKLGNFQKDAFEKIGALE